MRNFILQKRSLFLLAGLMASSLFAKEQNSGTKPVKNVCAKDDCLEPCDATLQCPPQTCGYNAPVLYNPCAYANVSIQIPPAFGKKGGIRIDSVIKF